MVCFVSPSTIWKTPGSGGPAEQKSSDRVAAGPTWWGLGYLFMIFWRILIPIAWDITSISMDPMDPMDIQKKTRMNWNCRLIIISPLFDGHKLYYYCGKAHVHTHPWLSWAPAILSPGRAIFGSTRGWQAACCHSFLPGKLTRNWS